MPFYLHMYPLLHMPLMSVNIIFERTTYTKGEQKTFTNCHLMMKREIFCSLFLICFCAALHAQETSVNTDLDRDYRKGMELLQQEKYAAAQEKFREAIVRISQLLAVTSHELLIHAKYYDALCSKELMVSSPGLEQPASRLLTISRAAIHRPRRGCCCDVMFDCGFMRISLKWAGLAM